MHVVLDPGHGGTDPGVVWTNPKTKAVLREKDAALATALTLKKLLAERGHKVTLTRAADLRPEYAERTARRDADLFLSVHFNSAGTYPLLYYASATPQNLARSKALAERLAEHLGVERVWASAQSRFNRLYIDDVTYGPALLWEVAAIEDYRDHREWRLERAGALAAALERAWEETFG